MSVRQGGNHNGALDTGRRNKLRQQGTQRTQTLETLACHHAPGGLEIVAKARALEMADGHVPSRHSDAPPPPGPPLPEIVSVSLSGVPPWITSSINFGRLGQHLMSCSEPLRKKRLLRNTPRGCWCPRVWGTGVVSGARRRYEVRRASAPPAVVGSPF